MGKRRSHRSRSRAGYWVAGVVLVAVVAAFSVAALMSERDVTPRDVAAYTPPTMPTPTPTPISPLAVFIGDSFVGGSEMGGVGKRNWTMVASSQMNWMACGFGVGGSGWTRGINDWTFGARIDWALKRDPSVVVFANGVNDLTSNPQRIVPDASATLAQLRERAPELPVIIVGPIRVRDAQSPFIERVNDDLAEVAAEYGAFFIDPTDRGWFDGDARTWLGEDNFHPTDEGSVYLADQFAAAVADLGIQVPQRMSDDARTGCNQPDWRQQHPDGTRALPSPSATVAP